MSHVSTRFLLQTIAVGVVAVGFAAPVFASQPTGNVEADCRALTNSAGSEPSWYASECRAYMPQSGATTVFLDGPRPSTVGDAAYQLNIRGGNTFETFVLPTAATTTASAAASFQSYAMEHDNATGVLWAIDNVGTAPAIVNSLGTVNKATGVF
ncbi:MAG: hypothetical protein ABIR16_09180, partial [Dokdonella sp.]